MNCIFRSLASRNSEASLQSCGSQSIIGLRFRDQSKKILQRRKGDPDSDVSRMIPELELSPCTLGSAMLGPLVGTKGRSISCFP